jgi:cation transport regulator ChaC
VSLSTKELENRLRTAQGKFELLRLREEISALMESPQFQQLSQSDKNRVEDLLVEVLAKEEQYKGCDPWRTILGY